MGAGQEGLAPAPPPAVIGQGPAVRGQHSDNNEGSGWLRDTRLESGTKPAGLDGRCESA